MHRSLPPALISFTHDAAEMKDATSGWVNSILRLDTTDVAAGIVPLNISTSYEGERYRTSGGGILVFWMPREGGGSAL
jgi:hypothetical protein